LKENQNTLYTPNLEEGEKAWETSGCAHLSSPKKIRS